MYQVQFSGSCSQDSGFQGNISQVPGTQFQGPMSQGRSPRVVGVRVSCPRVLESQHRGSQGLGSGSQGSESQSFGSQGPGSQVLTLDYAIRIDIKIKIGIK